jgi:hypothetical protein
MPNVMNRDLPCFCIDPVDDTKITDAYSVQPFHAPELDRLTRKRFLLQRFDVLEDALNDRVRQRAQIFFSG